jgi:hypothetical protein
LELFGPFLALLCLALSFQMTTMESSMSLSPPVIPLSPQQSPKENQAMTTDDKINNNDKNTIIMEGMLLKQASRLSQKYWHARYFEFHATDNTLRYYKHDNFRGSIPISNAVNTEISELFVQKHQRELVYCFRITYDSDDTTAGLDQSATAAAVAGYGAEEDEDNDANNDDDNHLSHQINDLDDDNHDQDSLLSETNLSRASWIQKKGDRFALDLARTHPTASSPKKKTPFKRPAILHRRSKSAHMITTTNAVANESNNNVNNRILANKSMDDSGHQNQSRGTSIPFLRRGMSDFIVQEQHQQPHSVISGSAHSTPPIGDVPKIVQVVENNNDTNTHRTPVVHNTKSTTTTTTTTTTTRKTYQDAINQEEQELLRVEYLTNQKERNRKAKERLVQGSRYAAAAGATIGVTVVTAGIGLVAGLVALGVAGAAGGGGAAMGVFGKRRDTNRSEIVIAGPDYKIVRQWKACLDAALESDYCVQTSTWGQLFASTDKNKARAAVLLPTGRLGTYNNNTNNKDSSQRNLNSTGSLLLGENARWIVMGGGFLSLVGWGYQGLRILREERDDEMLMPMTMTRGTGSRVVSHMSVAGKPSMPMKAHVVLNTTPLDAFLCLMSLGRIQSDAAPVAKTTCKHNVVVPQMMEHRITFEIIENIDEHTDVIHMVLQPLFLFPSWTKSRDFVLYRYWRLDPDGSYVVCYESVEHTQCPPLPDHVRAEMHQVFNIAPQKRISRKRAMNRLRPAECLMTATVQVDPKGWVPTTPLSFLGNQAYADAFGVAALSQLVEIRDAIDHDRFIPVTLDNELLYNNDFAQQSADEYRIYDNVIDNVIPMGITRNLSTDTGDETLNDDFLNYDFAYACNESTQTVPRTATGIALTPPILPTCMWAEPDSNSFRVRGPLYLIDKKKQNAGPSIGRLIAVDVVNVEEPIYSGLTMHPTERVQLALQKEAELKRKGLKSDLPPFFFVVNIVLPGPPFYHGVFYYAIDDMSQINGRNGSPSSKLCNRFFFGESDEFRDRTFKLIPQIVHGNFIVRKAVGSTPAIMGKKLRQLYVRNDRFFEVILDCGSSPVATGVIRLSLGYAKSLVIDMGFLLEGDEQEYLPERIFGCVRMKNIDFGPHLRKVTSPSSEIEAYVTE